MLSALRRIRHLLLLAVAASAPVGMLILQPTPIGAAPNNAGARALLTPEPPTKRTHLYELQLHIIELEKFEDSGGAIDLLGDALLLVTPRGRIATVQADGEVNYLPQRVPMYETAPERPIRWVGFRVADVLARAVSAEAYRLFVSHHFLMGDCVEFRVSSTELRVSEGAYTVSGEWKTEFRAHPCIDTALFARWGGEVPKTGGGIQAGGRMLMDGDGHLLVAIGDHGVYEWHELQEGGDPSKPPVVDPESHMGRLVRVELASGEAEIMAGGFRNPQGLARDREGNLWLTEHGPQGGDELNLVKPGLDYGWPFVTYGILYGNRVWPYSEAQGGHDDYEEPYFAWIPSIAVSNLIVSSSEQFPLWKDDLLVGSLRSGSLFRIRVREGRVVNFERISFGERIRDVVQMPDGGIAMLTDTARIILLGRAPVYCQFGIETSSIYTYDAGEICTDFFSHLDDDADPAARGLQGAALGPPEMRSLFHVHVHENLLVYMKSPCSYGELRNRFFLHITPVDEENVTPELEAFGFNVYDFYAYDEGIGSGAFAGGCVVVRPLPAYEIGKIYTGQVIREESPDGEVFWRGPIWEGSYTFGKPYAAAEQVEENSPLDNLTALPGAALFRANCSGCHLLVGEHSAGPHLEDIVGRRAGAVAGFSFSDALTGLDIVWTRDNLAAYLADPAAFAEGTTMVMAGITEEEAEAIADFLAAD